MEMEFFFTSEKRLASQYVVVGCMRREFCGGSVISEGIAAGFGRIFSLYKCVRSPRPEHHFPEKFLCRKSVLVRYLRGDLNSLVVTPRSVLAACFQSFLLQLVCKCCLYESLIDTQILDALVAASFYLNSFSLLFFSFLTPVFCLIGHKHHTNIKSTGIQVQL